jgi:hypothetical protein
MQLEDYFNFINTDDIGIKGHRIGIDNVLEYYLLAIILGSIVENIDRLKFSFLICL